MSSISKRIYDAVQSSGLSYGELSQLTTIPKSALQRYATGETEKVPLPRIEAIAKATGVSAAYLMGWEAPPAPKQSAPEPRPITDAELKFALFDGDQTVTDAQFEEVKRFAQFIRERDRCDK